MPANSGSETSYRAVYENTADAVIIIDHDGKIETVNPATELLFGYQRDEMLGKNVSLLLPENERSDHDRFLKKSEIYAPRIINNVRDLEGRHKSGRLFPMDLNVSPMGTGNRRKFVGIVRDITERKRGEDALKISEQRFRDFASAAADRLWETDSEHRYTYRSANPGSNFGSMVGVRAWETEPEKKADQMQAMKDLFENKEAFRDFHFESSQNDQPIYLRMSGTPFLDHNENFAGFRGT
ncbi:MAG: PAS domain S-box protein, partial [Rhodospirillales bacterium]|nr:PAS domain S-box protein [Rhodospirillales bacterium]